MFLPTPGALVAHRFRLRHAIGKGGMGQVWEAHDEELDGPCAVKFIVDHLARDPEARLRMVREARAVARLRSPHVVQILSVGEHEDAMYLAMELLEGESLASRLERFGKLDPRTTLTLLEQVVQVLDKAHASGVVHRDLKPDNIWIAAEPALFVKVLDFGIAKSTRLGAGATASGALMGTPQYMSPEQASGEREVDHRSDLWALAIIAMECLSGKRPYESSGLGHLLMKIMSTPPPPLHDLDPLLPASLGAWWQRALAHDPDQRFQNATQLLQGLRAGVATLPPARGPSPFDETARGNWADSPPAASPSRPHVPTLVTNISPTPVSQPVPTPALLLDRAAQGGPAPEPRERGTSVGPVTQTAKLARPTRPRRWAAFGLGSLLLAAVAFVAWRVALQARTQRDAAGGIDIHWSTLRPIQPGAEPPPAAAPPAAEPPLPAAAPPTEPPPAAPAEAQPAEAPPAAAATAQPTEALPASAVSAPALAQPAVPVSPAPSPPAVHQRKRAAPAPTVKTPEPGPRPERLAPGRPAVLPAVKRPPDAPSPAQDAKLQERLGF